MTTRAAGAVTGARLGRAGAWGLGAVAAAVAALAVAEGIDREALATTWAAITGAPLTLAPALAAYAAAFVVRAWAWRRCVPSLPFGHALAAIHLALAGNHVLPLRLGEPLRVVSATRRAGIPARLAASSTVTLRGADVLALAALAGVLGWAAAARAPGASVWVTAAAGSGLAAAGLLWARAQRRRGGPVPRRPGAAVALAATLAWLLEAVVMRQAAGWAGLELSFAAAAFVSVVAVAGQVAAIAPAGFGTYEAAGVAALLGLGVDAGTGLAVVLTAHAVKTTYALAAGGLALLAPAPGMLGRLRLPRARPPRPAAGPAAAGEPGSTAPVVLFLPALDEEATVAGVVARVPASVQGHPVRCLVVDDGSADGTAGAAARAGATVIRSERNRGLGAAVRRGLAEAVALGPAAVAFCDADGEYAPEELDRLVAPILAGTADYVVGSRFAGDIGRMLPHRRLGNRVLTRWVAFTARERVTDGQSGYRALSPAAAAAAGIAHDYNYAQVLTLDLLARGFRYAEVPISYRFRDHGRSFVRLGRYLMAVVPAVWRVVNRAPVPAGSRPAAHDPAGA